MQCAYAMHVWNIRALADITKLKASFSALSHSFSTFVEFISDYVNLNDL